RVAAVHEPPEVDQHALVAADRVHGATAVALAPGQEGLDGVHGASLSHYSNNDGYRTPPAPQARRKRPPPPEGDEGRGSGGASAGLHSRGVKGAAYWSVRASGPGRGTQGT